MKKLHLIVLLLTVTFAFAQHGRRDGNRIGISGGISNLSMFTSNFNTSPESGWIGGFAVRGNYYNDWSAVFGMQFTESNFSVPTTNFVAQQQQVKYTLSGVQVRFLFSYNIVKDHVSIDFGPVLQVNGALKTQDKYKTNIINGTALTVEDIKDITKINGNLYLGTSAGGKRVRAVIFYQYGLNNIMNNLNKKADLIVKNNGRDFKGHVGIISGQLLFNL
ncbi:PorT family protein [Flavobacterium amnicola]|uniref:PorT family protein n=1 Tax=Flavobacterium amnicola TaxID=2506422 RepID=A0A4Q1K8R1_9FLAO|nr:PorT family protein [Flavobacterium amnicola]RXR20969.1 PorT family protein [Flavobacterium amnicola]